MSHFTVMVIGNNPEKQLKPFDAKIDMPAYATGQVSEEDKTNFFNYVADEQSAKNKGKVAIIEPLEHYYAKYGIKWNGGSWRQHTDGTWWEYSTCNPNSKWDWYLLGGRWSGLYITLKEGGVGKKGKPGTFENETGIDQAFKGDIDFKAIEDVAVAKAAEAWEKVNSAISLHPEAHTWDAAKQMFPEDIKAARTFYHDQPQVKAFAKLDMDFFDSVEEFRIPKEDFLKRAANSSFSTFAAVKDGKWYQQGKMGWFGMSTDEMTEDQWNEQLKQMIAELPDDTIISIYDCHI